MSSLAGGKVNGIDCVDLFFILKEPKLFYVTLSYIKLEDLIACWSMIRVHSDESFEHFVKLFTVMRRNLGIEPFQYLSKEPIHILSPKWWLQGRDFIEYTT